MVFLFRRKRLQLLKQRRFWRATHTLQTTRILLLCPHMHSLYFAVHMLHWLWSDLTTWLSPKVIYQGVLKDSYWLQLACCWFQMFCCLCRWFHSLESYWKHCNWWGHIHGLQRWPLPIRYMSINQSHQSINQLTNDIQFIKFVFSAFLVVSAEVEMTAYGLLTYTLLGDVASALPVVKWLSKQRNALGGFSSTQVTNMFCLVIGLHYVCILLLFIVQHVYNPQIFCLPPTIYYIC